MSQYKIALIINEYSKGGEYKPLINEELYRQIDLFYKETFHKVSIAFTRSRSHIPKAITSLQNSGHNLFVICGGDGTINDVIQYLNKDTIIIPIPGGNANDFARRLNIFHWRDAIWAIKRIVTNQANIIGVDIGEVTFCDKNKNKITRRFINNCGVGVTAETVKKVEGSVNKFYLTYGFFTLLNAKPINITYYSSILKKNIHLSCLGFEILLCNRVGRYAHFAPFKHENDGTMNFIIFKNINLFQRLILMGLLKFGYKLISSGFVEYFHANPSWHSVVTSNSYNLSLTNIKEVWGMIHNITLMHTDGNIVPEFNETVQTDCRVKILPKFFKTIAPC